MRDEEYIVFVIEKTIGDGLCEDSCSRTKETTMGVGANEGRRPRRSEA